MTERALPAIGVGVARRPVAGTAERPVAVPRAADRPAVVRHEAILSMPARAGMLLGASAAMYAATLAGISVLQSRDDASLAATREPLLQAVAETRAANDALAARIQAANGAVTALITDYAATGADVAAYQAQLDSLAALVAEVQGSAAALPARIKLPTVSIRGPISSGGGGAAPKTSGKSGASGG
jgi:hypothetical protein